MKGLLLKLRDKIYDGDNIVSLSNMRYIPRWLVLIIDVFLLVFSLIVSVYVLNKMGIQPISPKEFYLNVLFIIGVNVVFSIIFRTYSGIIRHSTFVDLFKIILANGCTILTLLIFNIVSVWTLGHKLFLTPFLFVYYVTSFLFLFVFRLVVKEGFYFIREFRRSALKKRILVLGIDEESVALAKALSANTSLPFSVVGFLTQRKDSKKAKLLGKQIYTKDKIQKYNKQTLGIDAVLINKNKMSRKEISCWVNLFLEKKIQVLKAPSVQKMRANDNMNINNIQIEDLLNRRPIVIENEEVSKRHYQKNILITGGAGSIGSEIVRQVALFKPALVVVLDQAETPLYDIELEMKETFPNINFRFVLGDISNYSRLENLFEECQFSMVYHAAAYKHVPLVEEHPHEAVMVNIQGSKNLALLSSKYKVNRFVMISTDKAVNPTNVMGASKRVAELFVQALQNKEGNTTKFITTRFGNVLGSNGSVIPHFKKQIEKGGPVTITHPEIVRYFMTIPEACELVLEAGAMGSGGEIFVFDMGEPVKILDLAKRMIRLSGYEPDEDVKIIYTGLRQGEKLYEELLSDNTKTLPTHHSKILISKDEQMEYKRINQYTEQLYEQMQNLDNFEIVKTLKEIVKEFKSNNSIYEALDKE